MLHVKHTPPAYIDRLLPSPAALRYSLPHLHDRARQDLAAGDTLAYQRTMIRLADTEREIARQDELLENLLQAQPTAR